MTFDQTTRTEHSFPLPVITRTGQAVAAAAGIIGLLLAPAVPAWIKPVTILAAGITAVIFIAQFNTSPGAFARRLMSMVIGSPLPALLAGLTLLAVWAAGVLMALWQFSIADFTAGGWLSLLFLALWPWFTLSILLIMIGASYAGIRRFLINLMTGVICLVLCVVLLEGLCQVAYEALPSSITARMPQSAERLYHVNYDGPGGFRHYTPGLKITDRQGGSTGDLFFKSCLPPEEAQDEMYILSYTRDEYGFHNLSPWRDKVDLVVMGDSFVYAGGIERPFWDGIYDATLSLGMDATATLEQSLILKTYGLPRSPKVVVLAYYEGNDMAGNWEFFFNGSAQKGYERWYAEQPLRNFLVTYNILSTLKNRFLAPKCHWPVVDSQGQKRAFLEEEISISTIPYEALRQSRFYAITRDAIANMADEVRANGAQFVLVYIPTKLHAYWKLVQGQLEVISAHVISWDLPRAGGFVPRPDRPPQETAALLAQSIDAQHNLIAQFAQENHIAFLDFTPFFQQAAANGADPYFFGDSHWNQAGHDLARQILRDFLVALPI